MLDSTWQLPLSEQKYSQTNVLNLLIICFYAVVKLAFLSHKNHNFLPFWAPEKVAQFLVKAISHTTIPPLFNHLG